jgi:GMP synthase-like glutamine amidotransferase
MSERVVVVEHEAEAGLGYFAGWLAESGVEYEVVRPHLGESVPPRADAGLLVLGGAASAWDDEAYPWLPATRELIAKSVDAGVPTLGICLGAQLMTLAMGGEVERGGNGLEIGAGSIELLPEAADDRLLGPVMRAVRDAKAVQYHYDAMTELPPGAVRLATGTRYPNQAYRLGDSAWAVQFHPEATPEIFAAWTAAGALTDHDVEQLNSDVKEADEGLKSAWGSLARAFAGVLIERQETGKHPAGVQSA